MVTHTPDVYVNEISTLAPSIAEVSTAVPAFLGYTELVDYRGKNLVNTPVRITSMTDYISHFGGAYRSKFTVRVNYNPATEQHTIGQIEQSVERQHHLYYLLEHYFKNGGGDCYVVTLGKYEKSKDPAAFGDGLTAIAKADEPTLIMLSEAATLDPEQYYALCKLALAQCGKLMDRFCIFDVLRTDTDGAAFRTGIGTGNLKYGAAYYPYLNTTLSHAYEDRDITVAGFQPKPDAKAQVRYSIAIGGIRVSFAGSTGATVKVTPGTGTSEVTFKIEGTELSISNVGAKGKLSQNILEAWEGFAGRETDKFSITAEDQTTPVVPVASVSLEQVSGALSLDALKTSETAFYNAVKQELSRFMMVLPPSAAIAGVYATVDRERGVWKAPANVSLNAVIGPVANVTADDQAKLNIDAGSGKSINAIRSFYGKGTLVWGARTLAGNDNEWKYIPVRRLFNMIEESAKKASYFAVFEPNDASTWLKVRGMLESYLYGLWQQGALAGSTPKAAYYVNVGLGTTMTADDILNGKMIVEIGLAAVRPAEFIILNFSHKLQEA